MVELVVGVFDLVPLLELFLDFRPEIVVLGIGLDVGVQGEVGSSPQFCFSGVEFGENKSDLLSVLSFVLIFVEEEV